MNLNRQIDREMRLTYLWGVINGIVIGIASVAIWLNWEKLL